VFLSLSWAFNVFASIFLPYPSIKSTEQSLLEKLRKKNSHNNGNENDINRSPDLPSTSSSSSLDSNDGASDSNIAQAVVEKIVNPNDCAVIIPTHNSAAVISDTIIAASRHFPYKNIFIMDNGSKRTEANVTTEKIVQEISQEINYYFFPIPSKSVNLYLGAVMASSFEYLFVLDDDTLFPEQFCWPSRPSGITTSCGFNICAVSRKRTRENLIVKLQDWEYKIAGYRKYIQVLPLLPIRLLSQLVNISIFSKKAKTSTTLFHHGAIGFWKRETYQEIWKRHYALPLGDDRLAGMENLFLGNRMSYIASATPFQTVVPEQYIWAEGGTFWTVFKQRTFRWNVTNFRHIWMDVWLFFTYHPKRTTLWKTIWSFLAFRLFLTLELMSLYVTFLMPFTLVFLWGLKWRWWLIIHGALYASSVLQGFYSNYVNLRHRLDLRVEWYLFFLVPLYRFSLRCFRLLGILVSALVYIPLYPHPQRIDKRTQVM